MAEQNNKTLHQKQNKERPKIESIIEFLDGDLKKSVNEFLEYCKINKYSYPWGASNTWYIKYKGKRIGTLRIRIVGMDVGRVKYKENSWNISDIMFLDSPMYNNYIEKENLKDIIKNNVKRCEGCLITCAPGRTTTIFGKEFNNVCIGRIRFENPNGESLDCIKKLLGFRKELIENGQYQL